MREERAKFKKDYDVCETIAREIDAIHRDVTSEDFASKNLYEVKLLSSDLDDYWNRYRTLDKDLTMVYGLNQEFALALKDAKQTVTQMVLVAKPAFDERISQLQAAKPQPVKPKEIRLAKFDGDHSKWPAWRSQFMAKVYDTNLAWTDKLDLLLGALEDRAIACAGNSGFRDEADLARIWEKLCSRYDNQYALITENTKRLFDMPAADRREPNGIRDIIDTTEEQFRILKRYNTDGWSTLGFMLVFRKLDKSTQREWERHRTPDEAPTVEELLKFLEKECQAIQNEQAHSSNVEHDSETESRKGSASHSEPPQSGKRFKHGTDQSHEENSWYYARPHEKEHDRDAGKSNTSTSVSQRANTGSTKTKQGPAPDRKLNCWKCSKGHRLLECPKFDEMSAEDRRTWVEGEGICCNCLTKHHHTDECTRNGCTQCDGDKHHKALCPKQMVFQTNMVLVRKRSKKAFQAFQETNQE